MMHDGRTGRRHRTKSIEKKSDGWMIDGRVDGKEPRAKRRRAKDGWITGRRPTADSHEKKSDGWMMHEWGDGKEPRAKRRRNDDQQPTAKRRRAKDG